jgi:hypothetical protein
MSNENFATLEVSRKSVKHTLQRICRGANVDQPRGKAWKEIRAKLIEQKRFNPRDPEHTKILLRTFHDVSPTPQELFDTIKKKCADPQADRQRVLQELGGLDLVHNEAEFWMWKYWPIEQPVRKPRTKRQPSAKDKFAQEVRARQQQGMPRTQAWHEVQALKLLDRTKGLFISLWKFSSEEMERLEQAFYLDHDPDEAKTRRKLWSFLVGQLIINDHDRQEVAAFRRVFFSISETPEDLFIRIDELHQTHASNRVQARWKLIDEFKDQTIPNEIDYHLDDRWPEEEAALQVIVDFGERRRPIINETAVNEAMAAVLEMTPAATG